MCPHGFRATASTILDNMGYRQEWIGRQLAHEEPNLVKASYKRDLYRMYLPERRKMMQDWADYLDRLRQDDPARRNVGNAEVAGTDTAVEESPC